VAGKPHAPVREAGRHVVKLDWIRRSLARTSAALLLALSAHVANAAESSPADLISSFRIKHGEVRVVRDATLDRIALEQARAMAAKENLSHEVLGSFSSRIAPSRAGRAAENIAYGYDTFEKTLDQWIASSEHRKNLLLHNASRVGIASATDSSRHRMYWAMEIAGDYEPKPGKATKEPLVARRMTRPTASHVAAARCHLKLLGLCL
jgi:Cysteine-rich secretory protein family